MESKSPEIQIDHYEWKPDWNTPFKTTPTEELLRGAEINYSADGFVISLGTDPAPAVLTPSVGRKSDMEKKLAAITLDLVLNKPGNFRVSLLTDGREFQGVPTVSHNRLVVGFTNWQEVTRDNNGKLNPKKTPPGPLALNVIKIQNTKVKIEKL